MFFKTFETEALDLYLSTTMFLLNCFFLYTFFMFLFLHKPYKTNSLRQFATGFRGTGIPETGVTNAQASLSVLLSFQSH
jgi:hypothetical protein